MNRKVHAILISVPQSSAYPTKVIPGADAALDCFAALLTERFTDPAPSICVLKRPDATEVNVTAAFEEAGCQLSGDDLFIVLFIGHGRGSHTGHVYQAWALNDSEFTDKQLADHLSKLPKTIEVVIISDSCYGAGIATPGPRILPAKWARLHAVLDKIDDWIAKLPILRRYRGFERRVLVDAWTPSALLLASNQPNELRKLNQMVCIAAAASRDEVGLASMAVLVDMTISAVRANGTHGSLADAFEAAAVPGARFQVQARPSARMCTPLLAQRPSDNPNEKEDSMSSNAAAEETLTRLVFVNYSEREITVEINIQEDVGLQELLPAGVIVNASPEGATVGATLRPADEDGNFTLTLAAQVIAGFFVENVVALQPTSLLDVIAWARKDPPVPPSPLAPRLGRFPKPEDYQDLFEVFLGVGGADKLSGLARSVREGGGTPSTDARQYRGADARSPDPAR